jgi:ubiquinone/menaquinone biosynthesis C-methylase UbiE
MSTPSSFSFDPNQFKISQRQSWDSVAQGWKTWWEPIEKGAQALSTRLVQLAEIKPGYRILDIATGIGEPAMTAAKVVGSAGHVIATDISAQMLAIAKQRAMSIGMQDMIEFKESDAENIDFPDSFFDAVLCRWGLMLLPNLDATLSKILRTMISGRRFAAAVWSAPHKVPIISLASNIIRKELQIPPPQPGIPNPFSLADKKLENSLIKAGFRDVRSETVVVRFEFTSGEDYSRYCQAVSASARIALSKETEKRKEEIWKRIAEAAVRNYEVGNGLVRMDNESICVVGTRL